MAEGPVQTNGIRRVHVRVPATTANLGPGFDCMGMALDICDVVTLSIDRSGNTPVAEEGLNRGYAELVQMSAQRLYKETGSPAPELSIACQHGFPIGRGLGSSAAAIVAGLLCANELAGGPLAQEALVELAAELEGHPDNSTPCLLGGFQICVSHEGHLVHASVPFPEDLKAVLFIPDFPMPTHETRKLLPEQLSRADVVFQTGRAALLVAALACGRPEYLRVATQDRLHQPARGTVFPGMWKLFDAALDAGALCAYLSGGGPTVLALTQSGEENIREALQRAAVAAGVGGEARIARLSKTGAQVVGVV